MDRTEQKRFERYDRMSHYGEPVKPGYVSPEGVIAVDGPTYDLLRKMEAESQGIPPAPPGKGASEILSGSVRSE